MNEKEKFEKWVVNLPGLETKFVGAVRLMNLLLALLMLLLSLKVRLFLLDLSRLSMNTMRNMARMITSETVDMMTMRKDFEGKFPWWCSLVWKDEALYLWLWLCGDS